MEKPIETVVAATEAKNRFGSLIGKVADDGESIIVERQGKARAAIISMDEYRQFRALQDAERRCEAIATIWRLREEVSDRNKDMTLDEIESAMHVDTSSGT